MHTPPRGIAPNSLPCLDDVQKLSQTLMENALEYMCNAKQADKQGGEWNFPVKVVDSTLGVQVAKQAMQELQAAKEVRIIPKFPEILHTTAVGSMGHELLHHMLVHPVMADHHHSVIHHAVGSQLSHLRLLLCPCRPGVTCQSLLQLGSSTSISL